MRGGAPSGNLPYPSGGSHGSSALGGRCLCRTDRELGCSNGRRGRGQSGQDITVSCCFSEDGSKVITASYDGTVKVWDSYTGEELRTLRGHKGGVRSVSYRPSAAGSYI